jgi:hypothetical protein
MRRQYPFIGVLFIIGRKRHTLNFSARFTRALKNPLGGKFQDVSCTLVTQVFSEQGESFSAMEKLQNL